MKILLVVFVSITSILIADPISISDRKDYEVLDQFFKMNVLEEEYGYVLEGIKPISVRNYMPIERIHAYKDPDLSKKEFAKTLLVGKVINIWKKICSEQKKFALKAVPLDKTNITGWEVQFVNLAKLKEVIEENIALFRYILGPMIQANALADQLAYSDESFDSILHNDVVLIGLVLGFGTQNSVIGGRAETISCRTISKDYAPFQPKSQLMLSQKEHSMNVFRPQCYGGYYLEFAGGDDSHFQDDFQRLQPSTGFSTIEDEVIAIDAMNDDSYPDQLMQKPAFVFNAYRGGPSNKPFFNRLLQTQKRIQALLKRSDFLEIVLEKITGQKPIITCKKPKQSDRKVLADFTVHEWTRILQQTATRFVEPERQLAFFESYYQPTEASQEPPSAMIGASTAMLVGIKIALSNLSAANIYFETLAQDPSLESIIPQQLYFKTTQQGQGKTFTGAGRVRIGYVIEDLEGKILFANCDAWLNLSNTISGFAFGVQNMRVSENRTIYIHPAYGYGALTTLPPCSGLIIKAYLIDFDEKTSGILPLLTPIDMDWIQNPTFMADIESSLEKEPRYLGFLYRTMLDQIEGIDQSGIVAELTSQKEKVAVSSSQ